MRTFEKTHPWLTFSANLAEASPRLWIMLGECQSKCEHVAKAPLRPATARELYKVYLAKGARATTAIEGNTLSEEEVREHLDGALELPPSRKYLEQEVANVIAACNALWEAMAQGEPAPISLDGIRALNRTVLAGLELDEDVVPGELRSHSVVVGRYRGAPAEDCEFLLGKLADWLNGEQFEPVEGLDIAYAIIKAVLAHLYLAWIHPFGDGNGRTARLLEFQILLAAGVPTASAHLLSNHYNLTKTEYYRQLDTASTSGGDVLPFVSYAVRGLLDGLAQQLDAIWQQQWDVTWRNYVHEFFRDKTSASQVRRRRLVLDLSRRAETVPAEDIPDISTRLARAYTARTEKTLARDLNALVEAGLLERAGKGYRARKELILAFLPKRAHAGRAEE
ncbi:MAG: Fic family protein [Candidatus Hydrogenedentes bacterium]|nr:Fic family protein [Candidatus Hydrogenedentota bacterium]